jgi:hypothetical protein
MAEEGDEGSGRGDRTNEEGVDGEVHLLHFPFFAGSRWCGGRDYDTDLPLNNGCWPLIVNRTI